jgi:hypothetical protein
MKWLLRRLGIISRREDRDEYDLRRARATTTRAAFDHLRKIHREGMISNHVWEIITETVDPYKKELTESMQDVLKDQPEVETEELDAAWREFLQYQRLALAQLLADRGITEEVFNDLAGRIDDQLASSRISWSSVESMDQDLWQLRASQTELQPEPEDIPTTHLK